MDTTFPNATNLTTVPLAVTVPAAAAAFSYVNARASLWYDYLLFKSAFKGAGRVYWRQYRRNLNMFYLLEERAKNPSTANKDVLIFEGRHTTYAQLYDKALRCGHWLRTKYDIKPRDIVAMDFENSDTFIVVWWALWSIGAKPAFINYNLTGKPLSHCIRAANAKICFVDPTVAHNVGDDVKADLPGTQFVLFTPDMAAEAEAAAPVRLPDELLQEDDLSNMAVLIYTSGTTGLPKPAVVSWGKVIVGGTVAEVMLNRGGNDIMYTVCETLCYIYLRDRT